MTASTHRTPIKPRGAASRRPPPPSREGPAQPAAQVAFRAQSLQTAPPQSHSQVRFMQAPQAPPDAGLMRPNAPPRLDEQPLVDIPAPLKRPPQPSAKAPLELAAPAGGETVSLPLPPLEPGDLRLPINLATALRLADGRPLIVAAAQASAWSAEAQLQKASVLWVPAFMLTANYSRHDGPIDFNQGINVPQGVGIYGQPAPGGFGKPLNQNINWFIAGVSLYQVVATTDAIFQPLAARQNLDAKRWDIQTAKNDVVLEVARCYFNVHRFRGQYAGAIFAVQQGRKLVAAINTIGRDLAPEVETDRARNLLAFLEQQAISARANWRVASADLTQLLRLDARAVCEPLEQDHLQVTLLEPSRPLDELIAIGLRNRPELASRQAEIKAALVRIRQEKMRPLLPSVLLTGWETPGGMVPQASIFGTGKGSKVNNWSFRDDVSGQLIWQWDSFGFGNLALVKKRRGEQSQAIAKLMRAQDAVAAEINQAQAQVQAAAARVVQAERSLRTGLVTYQRSFEGLGQTRRFGDVLELIYRPQEVVYALKMLHQAFNEYFNTVADYNTSQFMLFHALGYPARELTYFRPPGEIVPVNTQRAGYLPAVGTGPPSSPR
ncbi:MAG TPA: TolC family protein [Pirellulales bacterium]|nr:TolC family protein [Pirellulales bacterium]